MKRNAYAKINTYLHITGRRPDGYHTLDTVMQSVSLHDTVSYRRTRTPLCFGCSDKALENEKNLCYKAANAFFEAVGLPASGRLFLTKRVPYGAGMGGGSSDGAATLRLLNDAFGGPLSEEELHALASSLGADVAFCLHGGKAVCKGIGEILEPLPDGEPLLLVIAKGEGGLSTPEMYRLFDERLAAGKTDGRAVNDFQPIAEERLPEISLLREELLAAGAESSLMTGSGSAVFGVFSDDKKARLCAAKLRKKGFFAKVCTTIPRY